MKRTKKRTPADFSEEERAFLNKLLLATMPVSLNTWTKRCARAITVLDQAYERRREDPECRMIPGFDYLKFLYQIRDPYPVLIRQALEEARTVATRAAALKGTSRRWKK